MQDIVLCNAISALNLLVYNRCNPTWWNQCILSVLGTQEGVNDLDQPHLVPGTI